MYVGVRAGGGIGDEIEDPAGDPYEMYRIVFDITFFFFVIVILLAIIQGMLTSYVRRAQENNCLYIHLLEVKGITVLYIILLTSFWVDLDELLRAIL